jgi:uncharacterized protein (TIGR00296 family)
MHPLVDLAKKAVENYIKEEKRIIVPEDMPEEFLKEKAGVFVTIKKNGKLRACLGTYLPTQESIAQEVIRNAISASTTDYRFGPIDEEELSSLFYSIYVLGEPQEITKKEDLNPKKYGILVRTNPVTGDERDVVFDGKVPFKSGLLLPGLEGINTIEEQFLAACDKGGINPEKEETIVYRFEVKKYEQE